MINNAAASNSIDSAALEEQYPDIFLAFSGVIRPNFREEHFPGKAISKFIKNGVK